MDTILDMTAVSSATQILATLRDAVENGHYEFGAALRQDELAAQFGVSRIPVREALQKLEAEGLLRIEPNRGAFVRMPAPEEVREAFDLLLLLEPDALRRAIPLHTPRSIRQLEAIQRELDFEDEPRGWLDLDQRFHDELYAPSQRVLTISYVKALRRTVNRFYIAMLSQAKRRKAWSAEHHPILEAVKNGQAKKACTALEEHIRRSADLTLEQLEK